MSFNAELFSNRLRIVEYINVASLSILVVDYFIAFEREVSLIWRSEWSAAKILFLLARYIAFVQPLVIIPSYVIPDIPLNICASLNTAMSCIVLLTIAVAQAILVLRTYAIWGNKTVLYFLVALQIVLLTIDFGITLVTLTRLLCKYIIVSNVPELIKIRVQGLSAALPRGVGLRRIIGMEYVNVEGACGTLSVKNV